MMRNLLSIEARHRKSGAASRGQLMLAPLKFSV